MSGHLLVPFAKDPLVIHSVPVPTSTTPPPSPYHPLWRITISVRLVSLLEMDGLTIFYPEPLWDGDGCGPTSTCCEFNNPPYFCKQLPEATTDDIEVRICASESLDLEDTLIDLVEVFVQ